MSVGARPPAARGAGDALGDAPRLGWQQQSQAVLPERAPRILQGWGPLPAPPLCDLPGGACPGEGGLCAEKPGAGGGWKQRHPSGLGKVAFACG